MARARRRTGKLIGKHATTRRGRETFSGQVCARKVKWLKIRGSFGDFDYPGAYFTAFQYLIGGQTP